MQEATKFMYFGKNKTKHDVHCEATFEYMQGASQECKPLSKNRNCRGILVSIM